jgi:transaldolase
MKFYLDTANINEIREAATLGILDGITTNPSLVAKEGRDFHSTLREISSIVNGPISAEVTATEREGMVREGRELARIHPNIVVKVPSRRKGCRPARSCAGRARA